jgi:hypothetical protein
MISKIISFIICNPPIMNLVCFSVPVISIIFTVLEIKKILEK